MSAAPTHTRRFVTRTAGGARFADLARRCADEDRGAFVPFLVIGDPSLDAFQDFPDALVEAGAAALALGLSSALEISLPAPPTPMKWAM